MKLNIDLKNARNILIVVANRIHRVEFLQEGTGGEIFFKITERDHPYLHAHTGGNCCVYGTIGNDTYFFRGKISSHSPEKAVVFVSSLAEAERRRSVRYETISVPARVKEKAFMRTNVIPASIINLNGSGAQISTSIPLEESKVYTFEAALPLHHTLRPFSAVCYVRYSRRERDMFVSGLFFEEGSIQREHKETLNKFLSTVSAT